jgi:DNA-binding response OmpR family regulator
VRKILLVEDEDLLRESYYMIISTEPYDIDVAKNGQEALDKCTTKRYDLILLDLMMPVLDGVGFLERFNNPTNTKIIILSNLSSGAALESALQLGAQEHLIKATLSPRELLSKIRYDIASV